MWFSEVSAEDFPAVEKSFHHEGRPTRQALLAPSTKHREVFGESHEGCTASVQEPLVRRTSASCSYFLAYG